MIMRMNNLKKSKSKFAKKAKKSGSLRRPLSAYNIFFKSELRVFVRLDVPIDGFRVGCLGDYFGRSNNSINFSVQRHIILSNKPGTIDAEQIDLMINELNMKAVVDPRKRPHRKSHGASVKI